MFGIYESFNKNEGSYEITQKINPKKFNKNGDNCLLVNNACYYIYRYTN
jgi:hypothetical protein